MFLAKIRKNPNHQPATGSGILQTTIKGILGDSMNRRLRRKISAAAALSLEGKGSLVVPKEVGFKDTYRPATYKIKGRKEGKCCGRIPFLGVLEGQVAFVGRICDMCSYMVPIHQII